MKRNREGTAGGAERQGPKPAPRKRRTQLERSTQTRGKLLDAAMELLHESGFGRLTVNDVAHRAGLTSGAVQHHFSSSRALIRGVVDRLYPILRVPIEHLARPELEVGARVDRLIDEYWKIYGSPEYLVFWDIIFGTRDEPELRDFMRALQKNLVGQIVADFARVFPDLRLSGPAATLHWTFVGNQLRGLAMLSLFEGAPVLAADLVLLKETVRTQLEKYARAAPKGRRK